MPGKIYLIQNDKSLQALTQQDYPNEDDFQTLLEQYPDLLAGDQMNEGAPRRWLLVAREMGVPSEEGGPNQWSLDHLFLDQDGIPTLVEVKRRGDTRLRREVVGQMLDYAANAVVYWPLETVQECFAATCEKRQVDPSQLLAELLRSAPDDEAAMEAFWAQVKTNLQAARIRLVFVADEIPPELRRIVEFLKQTMDPVEVQAVEIHQYVGQGLKTLVPRVIGSTRKPPVMRPKGQIWDEQMFFKALTDAQNPEVVRVVRAVYEWAQEHASINWGRAPINGAFYATLQHDGVDCPFLAVWNWVSGTPPAAYVEIQGTQLRAFAPFNIPEHWRELCRRLSEFWPRSLANADVIKVPQASMAHFVDDSRLQALFRVLEWAADRIREEPARSGVADAQ